MIVPLVGAVASWVTAWAGLGFTLDPAWWPSLLVPGAWAVGVVFRRRGAVVTGFLLSVGLAGGVALTGRVVAALVVIAFTLWSWDLGLLWISRLAHGDPGATARLARAAVVRSTALAVVGLGVGTGFLMIRIRVPFWWLVGGTLSTWLGLMVIVRGFRRAYRSGGDASGNRSFSSGPIM